MNVVNANPLINSDPSDTIDAVRVYLRFLCQGVDEDEGMRLALLVAVGALDSLPPRGDNEKSFAQSV